MKLRRFTEAVRAGHARFLILGSLAATLLAGVALSLYWTWAAERIALGIEEWTQVQRTRGYDIAYQGPSIGGFPTRFSIDLIEPRVRTPLGWHWSGDTIAGESMLWAPRRLRIAVPLRQRFGGFWSGRRHAISVTAEAARGVLELGHDGSIARAAIEVERLSLQAAAGWTLRAAEVDLTLRQAPPRREGRGEPITVLTGAAREIVLSGDLPSPLGETIGLVALDASLVGGIPTGDPAQALGQWRESGGRLEIHKLTLHWGPLDVEADGTVALDAALRPQGAFTARVRGLPETIDALAARGLVKTTVAFAVKLALLALARVPDQDGKTRIQVPITLRDGSVYLGPVALFSVGPVL